MTSRRVLPALPGVVVGFWPAGLLVGGLDFYPMPGGVALGFLVGIATTGGARRHPWLVGVGVGLIGALGLHLLTVGAEWRFIRFAFERALPFIAAALAGAVARAALEHLRPVLHS